jgi:hypothetical protein
MMVRWRFAICRTLVRWLRRYGREDALRAMADQVDFERHVEWSYSESRRKAEARQNPDMDNWLPY